MPQHPASAAEVQDVQHGTLNGCGHIPINVVTRKHLDDVRKKRRRPVSPLPPDPDRVLPPTPTPEEELATRRLADLPNVPPLCGTVTVNGAALSYAVAHDYVEGRPLCRDDMLPESFQREGFCSPLRLDCSPLADGTW